MKEKLGEDKGFCLLRIKRVARIYVKIAGSLINQGFLFSSDKFYAVNEKAKIIDTNTVTRIKEIARANGVTENVFFQNIWEVALMNFLKTKDVVVGSVVSGRDTSVRGIENIAGLLMTVLPVRLTEGCVLNQC